MNSNTTHWSTYLSIPNAWFCRPQLVALTFGYRKRNQKKIRRMRRQ